MLENVLYEKHDSVVFDWCKETRGSGVSVCSISGTQPNVLQISLKSQISRSLLSGSTGSTIHMTSAAKMLLVRVLVWMPKLWTSIRNTC